MLAVGPNTRVTLHFSLLLANGEEVDTTRTVAPGDIRVGDGSLLPGFERALFGLAPATTSSSRYPRPTRSARSVRRTCVCCRARGSAPTSFRNPD